MGSAPLPAEELAVRVEPPVKSPQTICLAGGEPGLQHRLRPVAAGPLVGRPHGRPKLFMAHVWKDPLDGPPVLRSVRGRLLLPQLHDA